MRQKISIKKIAEIAGVSTCTVSKILNNTGSGYSENTARKVNAIVESLNYVPDAAAKTLRESKSYTIGLLVPNIKNDFFASLALHLEKEVHKAGYSLFIGNGYSDEKTETNYFRALASKSVDGIISCSGLSSLSELCRNNNIPHVCVGRHPQNQKVHVVAINNRDAGECATTHLIEKGCRHILFLGYSTAEENRIAREAGYMDALKKHGLFVDRNYIQYCDKSIDSSMAVCTILEEILYSQMPIDGIFAANDIIAVAAMTYLLKQGIPVPDDIRIIGFDNSTYSRLTYPGISTIDIHTDLLAKKAFSIMQKLIMGKRLEEGIIYSSFDLIERESTK